MTAQQSGDASYEVIEWDFDAAPDAAEYLSQDYSDEEYKQSILPYYCAKRRRVRSLRDAIDIARNAVEGRSCRIGAAVFLGEKLIQGFGLTFTYRKKYV